MAIRLNELEELWGAPLRAAAEHQDVQPGAGLTELRTELRIEPDAICTDSRRLQPGDLFVPLVGETFDGHAFLEQALAGGGAAAAIAQADRLTEAQQQQMADLGRPLWLVPDTLLAYQQLGRLWRDQLRAPVVAVTGSAGKTTTRELIRACLDSLGPVVASSGNENNDIGVPLTLLKARTSTAALVVEMGMRGLGEIERLSQCAAPDVSVITNIGTAHIGRLGSREAIAQAKCEICLGLKPDGLLVIPAGDPLLETALARVWSGEVWRVALSNDPASDTLPPADWIGHLSDDGRRLEVHHNGRIESVSLPLEGQHNARNLLLALAVADRLGVAPQALTALEVDVPGGRNRRRQMGGLTVLDETYNASPEAVLAALELLASQPGRRFAVLGTMLELGDRSLDLHRQVAERAAALGLDGLVIVDGGAEGEAMLEAARSLPRLARVSEAIEAMDPLRGWINAGDVVLLKASRGVALERLLPCLERESWN
ncbi:UDP-N-acetylmuramoyl-tripeptide--D-alanyl-D-alanine ligase [Synechococcus sp. CBW1002]|uniref:UDP-N-acetylmuramoyl-tripeptide--D-alanyl-D- alanine ligase n=1 Tax=Synechococcus sp. CBW1002 TaxID=1353134 RepID=UPI0018CD789A|nr:UDP-N-acetylmuramoyl-tripeptide--D-alanyl-D-alanine ligase [Synechococcus sp. CBW1002]QPN59345.1 UDP-N-acetylmuramoyl-tripeptide--D-alanyl-D-alanine ligase [Synechococcus sp. CBW1002]